MKDKNSKTNNKSFAREIFETIVFVLVAVIVLRFFLGEMRWIPSSSMYPSFLIGDRIFVEKVTKPIIEPKRGDVIVFYPPDEVLKTDFFSVIARLTGIFCKDIVYIKRIVAVPGDIFEIQKEDKNFFVAINGVKLNEPYILSSENWMECTDDMYCGPFVIPENNYFMMGDNRGNSVDSRFWGFLPKKNIIGRAVFRWWPLYRVAPIINPN